MIVVYRKNGKTVDLKYRRAFIKWCFLGWGSGLDKTEGSRRQKCRLNMSLSLNNNKNLGFPKLGTCNPSSTCAKAMKVHVRTFLSESNKKFSLKMKLQSHPPQTLPGYLTNAWTRNATTAQIQIFRCLVRAELVRISRVFSSPSPCAPSGHNFQFAPRPPPDHF